MTGIVTTQFNSLPNGPSANGNAMASIEFDLVADEIVSIDVNNGAPGQGLSRIESLYVDNTRGGGYLFFVFNDVKRLLIVPPGAEGCYPTYSAASYFRVGQAQSKSGVHVRCKAFACTKHSFERFPGAGGLLQNPLDFNNTNGATPAAASAPVVPPRVPVSSGWDTSFASPYVAMAGATLTQTDSGSEGVNVPWARNSSAFGNTGKRIWQMNSDFYGSAARGYAAGALGFITVGETPTYPNYESNKCIWLNGNGAVYNGMTIIGQSSIGGPNLKTVTIEVDFVNNAFNIWIDGTVIGATGAGAGNPHGIDMKLFNLPIAPAAMLIGVGMRGTMNSLGPFLFPAIIPFDATPWDAN